MRHTFYTSICLCSLFSLVLFVMCLAGCTGQQSPISFYRKPLMTLDSLIALRPRFQAEKEQEIKAAKKKLGSLPASSPKRYELNKEIQQLYRGYICDSLIYYIYENIRLSRQLKDHEKTLESEMSLAVYLAKSGMYLEALVLMDSIKRADVNDELLDLYYRAYNLIYRQKAYISKDKVLAERVFAPLAKVYQDSLFAVVDSGLPEPKDEKRAERTETSVQGGFIIVDYSEKAIVVFGDTKPVKDALHALGGRFNARLTHDGQKRAGWIFQKTKEDEVRRLLGKDE